MPRAQPITRVTTTTFTEVAKYAEEFLSSAFNIKVSRDELVLTNTATKSTYFVYPCIGADGCVDIHFTSDYLPVNGKRTTLLVAFDIKASTFYVMEFDSVMRCASEAINKGGGFAGMQIMQAGDQVLMRFNVRQCTESKVIARQAKVTDEDDKFESWRMLKLATPERFVHLHGHSHFSLLDGACSPEGIARQAKMNGQSAIALTDHGNVFGSFKFAEACREAEIKGIFGVEAYMVHDVRQKYLDRNGHAAQFNYHQTLIAMNDEGWENLCTMLTISNSREHFYYKNLIDLPTFAKYHKGIIALGGCFKGMVAFHCMDHDPVATQEKPFIKKDLDAVRNTVRWYKSLMGDRYFGEAMKIPGFRQYDQALNTILQMYRDEGVPVVATNDYHYETEADWKIQQMLSRISKETETVASIDGTTPELHPHWIKPVDLMQDPRFDQSFYTRTCEIADRCTLRWPMQGKDKDFRYLFPVYPVAQDRDWSAYQQHLVGALR